MNEEFKPISVLLMILLSIITFGFYPFYWFFSRRRDLLSIKKDSLPRHMDKLLWLLVALHGFSMIPLPLAKEVVEPLNFFRHLLTLVPWFYVTFTFRDAFESLYSPTHRRTPLFSTGGTFFFSVFYMQYMINRLLENNGQIPVPEIHESSDFKPEKVLELMNKYNPKTTEELKSILSDAGYSDRARFAVQSLLKKRGAI
ncbi:MAG: DUF4234 domain-containing protein [Elusimicrobia bacterium]|nr:DUF4234 domain-containing protein [Elusimicrobiota bacterium]